LIVTYTYDVFISYARVNPELTLWVSTFHQKLESKLREKLPGGSTRVFIDTGELGVGSLKSEFAAALSSSRILLIVLSNRWFERQWCQDELETFVTAAGGLSNARHRIVFVRIEDVQQDRIPEKLRDCHTYDFFTLHPTRKITLRYGSPELPELESQYLLSLLELVGDERRPGLVTRLIELNRPQPPQRNGQSICSDDQPMVLLANCTPDLNRDRCALRRHLEDKGFRVVPTGSFYHAPPSFEAEYQDLLEKCVLFIQIVGPFRFETTAAFPNGYEVWQLEKARNCKGSDLLRWRRPDLLDQDVEDEAHRNFVFAEDVTECDLEEFKVTLEHKLREIASRRTRTPDQLHGSIVLVNAAASDSRMAQEIGIKVEDLGLEMRLGSVYADVVAEESSLLDVAVNNPFDGLVIVYGECEQNWVRRQMIQGRSAALQLKPKAPVCAVYVGPPKDKRAPEPRPARFGLIDFRNDDQLRDFVREVSERRGER
jgi:TIR domain